MLVKPRLRFKGKAWCRPTNRLSARAAFLSSAARAAELGTASGDAKLGKVVEQKGACAELGCPSARPAAPEDVMDRRGHGSSGGIAGGAGAWQVRTRSRLWRQLGPRSMDFPEQSCASLPRPIHPALVSHSPPLMSPRAESRWRWFCEWAGARRVELAAPRRGHPWARVVRQLLSLETLDR